MLNNVKICICTLKICSMKLYEYYETFFFYKKKPFLSHRGAPSIEVNILHLVINSLFSTQKYLVLWTLLLF